MPRITPREIELRRAGKARLQQTRQMMVRDLKLRRGCVDCGYNAHAEALHFDHLPGVEKRGKVCDLRRNNSIEALLLEIAKCEVVCANCHAIRTAKRQGRS